MLVTPPSSSPSVGAKGKRKRKKNQGEESHCFSWRDMSLTTTLIFTYNRSSSMNSGQISTCFLLKYLHRMVEYQVQACVS